MRLKIFRLLLILLLAGLFIACAKKPPEKIEQIEYPAENGDRPHTPENITEEFEPQPEIPQYNEYNVSLDIDPEARTVKGIERIRFTNRTGEALEQIVCRVFLNAFSEEAEYRPYFASFETSIFPHGRDYGYMNILHVSLDNEELFYSLTDSGTVLTIELVEPLAAEETIQLRIQFVAYVPRIRHRTGSNGQAMWCGAFLPLISVYGKNGWHTEPYGPVGNPVFTDTAHYTVNITTPENYTVTGTGKKNETVLEEHKVSTFTAAHTRDFAFALSPSYKNEILITPSGIEISLFYYSDGVNTEDVLAVTAESLYFFQEMVGIYPYSQLCIAETGLYIPGMEFSKIIFIDSDMLGSPLIYMRMVQEVGRQWFFNVIGNNAALEPWLAEGLTLFLQDMFFYPDRSELRGKLQTDYSNFAARYKDMRNVENKKISRPQAEYENWNEYYLVQQQKSKLMIYGLFIMMGDEMFAQFLNGYYHHFAFGNASSEGFISLAESIIGSSLNSFFNLWLNNATLPDFPE
ncbi:MAG: M1 family metallopeptidase [Defluviitaleaceae bacterium]|nr:M1 family metallopeptidase [Defluviitaleaceae bacterium]